MSVIELFTDIHEKHLHTLAIFDIENFYLSITQNLLQNALSFAKTYCSITDKEKDIIMHARKSIMFSNGSAWIKKDSNVLDVTMGSFDGTEVCELVGLFILDDLCGMYGKGNIGLYRGDGIAVFKNTPGPQAERERKNITKYFTDHGLNITILTNMKSVSYLDVTLNLTTGTYRPYRKPNDQPLYINKNSNHPPNIIKHLPDAIGRRISVLSCNNAEFEKATPLYENALKSSGYTTGLTYNKQPTRSKRKQQRNIIWYNPPPHTA